MKHIILAVIGLSIAFWLAAGDWGNKQSRLSKQELISKQTAIEKQRHHRRW